MNSRDSHSGLFFSPKWHDYFLNDCLHKLTMSKDPNTMVGAVIVGPDKEVRSTGFNGFPRGIADTADRLSNRELKNKLMVHAEMNAILSAARIGVPLKHCTLYLACTDASGKVWGGPPCTRCTVEIIQTGISTIVSRPFKTGPSKWKDDIEFSRSLLEEAGVCYIERLR